MDKSYNHIKLLCLHKDFKGNSLEDLSNFSQFGFFLKKNQILVPEELKNKYQKDGFIKNVIKKKGINYYEFYPCNKNIDISKLGKKEILEIKKNKIFLHEKFLKNYNFLELNFSGNRDNQTITVQHQQIPKPLFENKIISNVYVKNIFELARYRANIKNRSFDLIGSFVSELSEIKDDLFKYLNYFKNSFDDEEKINETDLSKNRLGEKFDNKNKISLNISNDNELIKSCENDFKKKEFFFNKIKKEDEIKINYTIIVGWKLYRCLKGVVNDGLNFPEMR